MISRAQRRWRNPQPFRATRDHWEILRRQMMFMSLAEILIMLRLNAVALIEPIDVDIPNTAMSEKN